MKIGDKVKLKDELRYLSHSGAYTYLDEGIDIDGIVTGVFNYFSPRVSIEFKYEGLTCTIWKDVVDIPTQN